MSRRKKTREGEDILAPAATSTSCQYWLMKSEPDAFSIDDLAKAKTSPWDGVRNYAARNNMKLMQLGDRVLFYHSNAKPSGVVGLALVCKLAYPDHTATCPKSKYFDPRIKTSESNPWMMVDVQFDKKFDRVLSLDELRKDAPLAAMKLFSHSRLSVQPVDKVHFMRILELAARAAH